MTKSKIIKGKVMSASMGGAARRRLSLLAGSSLVASLITLGSAALAPGMAAAQTATCVPAPASGNGTAAVTYNAGAQNPGITCAYTGVGATVTTNGAVTVSSAAPGGGVNLTAVGGDSITWVSNGNLNGGAQTNGPILEATSVSGPISITVAAMIGTQPTVTYGINAVSTGGGAVNVTNTAGNINVNPAANAVNPQQLSAIRAISTGGNGAVSVSTVGAVTGRQRGIEAQASGTGSLTVNAAGAVGVNTAAGMGVAAIDARTGTGLLTINLAPGAGAVHGQSGSGILTNAGGNATITIGAGRSVQSLSVSGGALNLTSVGTTTLTTSGAITANAGADVAIRAAGGGFTLVNTGDMRGRLELGAVTGVTSVTHGGTWLINGESNFGAGASTLTNNGTITFNGDATFVGLETFNNSGTLSLGASTLTATGIDFSGSGSSLLRITTTLDQAGTTGCGTATAGCLDLSGGTTSGVTAIRVTVDGDSGTNLFNANPIVVVDVSGGTSAQGHFVLDAANEDFAQDRLLGDILALDGLFGLALRYDPDTQQHVLLSAPRADAFEFAPVIHEALSTWHTTTDLVTGRQADLAAGAGGGLWVRAAAENTDRELAQSFTSSGSTFTVDNGYSLETGTVIAGFDLVKGRDVTFGVHGGLVRSELTFDGSGTSDDLNGPTAGFYGTWRSGPFSLDGTFNANLLELERTSPTFEDSVTNVLSFGGRAEAAWRIGGQFFFQPLVTAAYVKSTIDDVLPTGYDITFEDAVSSRAAVGLRAGGEAGVLTMWAVARAWKEFSGDGSVSINNSGTTTGVVFADDLSGDFQEVGGGLSVGSESDTLRGYVSAGAKFANDIDNYSLSLGVRVRW